MGLWVISVTRRCRGAWIFLWGVGLIISLGLAPYVGAQDDVQGRLEAGEIIVSSKGAGGARTCGEMMALIDAAPELVWQVLNDVNNFKNFMPRTLNSMAVAPEKLPLILARKPSRAEEVEQLLGPVPADPASYRVPGGEYTVYLYSNLDFPWPCKNRWYIIKGLKDETGAAQHRYHSSWSLVIGNLRENSGEWNLEPFGSGKTKATYRLCTDPGGAIPEFLIKQGPSTTMPQIIKAVRKRVADGSGRPQP
jgi:hypothetical protein